MPSDFRTTCEDGHQKIGYSGSQCPLCAVVRALNRIRFTRTCGSCGRELGFGLFAKFDSKIINIVAQLSTGKN